MAGYDKYDGLLAESASNFTPKNSALSGKLSLTGRPPLSLSISVNQNGFRRRSSVGQYSDGSNTVNISVSDASPRLIRIASTDGVSLEFSVGAETADLMKGNAKVAVVNLKTGMIHYTDGSFESLK